jgi:hypothetical protein
MLASSQSSASREVGSIRHSRVRERFSLRCFFGFHDIHITRKLFWGNCHRAELFCLRCGRRYEGFAAGPSVGYLVYSPTAGDFWRAYDSGAIFVDEPTVERTPSDEAAIHDEAKTQ